MRPAIKLALSLPFLLLLSACAPKTGLSEVILDLEREVKNMRSESAELRKRINELENRLDEMYEETVNQSEQINETTDGLH